MMKNAVISQKKAMSLIANAWLTKQDEVWLAASVESVQLAATNGATTEADTIVSEKLGVPTNESK